MLGEVWFYRRILSGPNQGLLPFESEEEYQAAKEEAEAEAKQRRNESLPADLPRVEIPVPVDESLRNCPTHGERQKIGEDVQETLVVESPKAY